MFITRPEYRRQSGLSEQDALTAFLLLYDIGWANLWLMVYVSPQDATLLEVRPFMYGFKNADKVPDPPGLGYEFALEV